MLYEAKQDFVCPSEARKCPPNGSLMPLLDYSNISYSSVSQLQHSGGFDGMEIARVGLISHRPKTSAIRHISSSRL